LVHEKLYLEEAHRFCPRQQQIDGRLQIVVEMCTVSKSAYSLMFLLCIEILTSLFLSSIPLYRREAELGL